MNPLKLHCIIEYIREQPDFPFEAEDVDEDLMGILSHYGFEILTLTTEETEELRRELRRSAWAEQDREVIRLVEQSLDTT